MTRRPEEFRSQEEVWRKRVEGARERYLAAQDPADRERKREARAEYMRVLHIFANLIMTGQAPPDEE